MYADRITESMQRAIRETERRRKIQMEFNRRNGITPRTIRKAVRDILEVTRVAEENEVYGEAAGKRRLGKKELKAAIARMEKEMREAARMLEFERAAQLRDILIEMRLDLRGRDRRITAVGDEGEPGAGS
jgi:excinuclease ABC subunit B